MSVTLRPATTDDETFLFALYCSTREEEIAAWGWNTAQREAFLRMQFQAQRQHYRMLDGAAEESIVCLEGCPVGWIAMIRSQQILRLADIALLPEQRNSGIGTALIQGMLAAAADSGSVVQLHVLRTNRAFNLYQRLGFRVVGEDGLYIQMECHPDLSDMA
jgi:ribosomal protein S18 acetylase RimI-like enzyme